MPGSHPVLGLLAVAVCISYSQGAPFSAGQKDDTVAYKLHNAKLNIPATAIDDGSLPNTFYIMNNKIAEIAGGKNTNVFDERSNENIIKAAGFKKLQVSRSKGQDAVITKSEARKSDSGDIDLQTREGSGLLGSAEQSESSEESSVGSEASGAVSSSGSKEDSLGGLPASHSQEECEDENNGTTDGKVINESPSSPTETPPPETPSEVPSEVSSEAPSEAPSETSSSPTTTPNNEDEECEDTEPPNETSSSEDSEMSTSSQEVPEDECDDSTDTTTEATTTRRSHPQRTSPQTRPTKTRNPDQSDGSFHDSDPDGVDFSDGSSQASDDHSTPLTD